MLLSLCIATYNEGKNIHYPLESAYDFVDEVVIVDGGSTDKTVEIAKSYGKKVRIIKTDNPAMFHKNKQKAIEAAHGEWILQLDADEALSKELKDEIKVIINPKSEIRNPKQIRNQKTQNHKQFKNLNLENSNLFRASSFDIRISQKVAYWVPRKNFFLTRFLMKGGQYPDYTIRLYKNGFARFPCKSVHENVEIIQKSNYQLSITNNQKNPKFQYSNIQNKIENWKLNIGYLNNPILHHADPTFSRYLQRWDRYTTLDANILFTTQGFASLHFFDYFFLKPSVWFFSTYFRHLGFLDGFPGFVFALFSSLRFWVIYVKLWTKTIKKTE
ncbi:hypothetical protein A2963_02650 [Candidatus Roizmanbacteria bacterium RIFCSPLOWO2_01_FULL_40_13]|nr:MAG: hypothetical protein A2963_02650 [Candidatus Roizmanbacteria bacterium RIFCSPLOWO2_01_FULL_40_13]